MILLEDAEVINYRIFAHNHHIRQVKVQLFHLIHLLLKNSYNFILQFFYCIQWFSKRTRVLTLLSKTIHMYGRLIDHTIIFRHTV